LQQVQEGTRDTHQNADLLEFSISQLHAAWRTKPRGANSLSEW
jgi:hypothetical protein